MDHFVYRPNYQPKIVSTEEYGKHLESGWYDTPAKFPKPDENPCVDGTEVKRRGRPPKNKIADEKILKGNEEDSPLDIA